MKIKVELEVDDGDLARVANLVDSLTRLCTAMGPNNVGSLTVTASARDQQLPGTVLGHSGLDPSMGGSGGSQGGGMGMQGVGGAPNEDTSMAASGVHEYDYHQQQQHQQDHSSPDGMGGMYGDHQQHQQHYDQAQGYPGGMQDPHQHDTNPNADGFPPYGILPGSQQGAGVDGFHGDHHDGGAPPNYYDAQHSYSQAPGQLPSQHAGAPQPGYPFGAGPGGAPGKPGAADHATKPDDLFQRPPSAQPFGAPSQQPGGASMYPAPPTGTKNAIQPDPSVPAGSANRPGSAMGGAQPYPPNPSDLIHQQSDPYAYGASAGAGVKRPPSTMGTGAAPAGTAGAPTPANPAQGYPPMQQPGATRPNTISPAPSAPPPSGTLPLYGSAPPTGGPQQPTAPGLQLSQQPGQLPQQQQPVHGMPGQQPQQLGAHGPAAVDRFIEYLVGAANEAQGVDQVISSIQNLLQSGQGNYNDLETAFKDVLLGSNYLSARLENQKSILPVVDVLCGLDRAFQVKMKEQLLRMCLTELNKERPASADRVEFYAYAECFAAFVFFGIVPVNAAVKTFISMLKVPGRRCAVMTALGKTTELCLDVILRTCDPNLVQNLIDVLRSVTEPEFHYDLDYILGNLTSKPSQ